MGEFVGTFYSTFLSLQDNLPGLQQDVADLRSSADEASLVGLLPASDRPPASPSAPSLWTPDPLHASILTHEALPATEATPQDAALSRCNLCCFNFGLSDLSTAGYRFGVLGQPW